MFPKLPPQCSYHSSLGEPCPSPHGPTIHIWSLAQAQNIIKFRKRIYATIPSWETRNSEKQWEHSSCKNSTTAQSTFGSPNSLKHQKQDRSESAREPEPHPGNLCHSSKVWKDSTVLFEAASFSRPLVTFLVDKMLRVCPTWGSPTLSFKFLHCSLL